MDEQVCSRCGGPLRVPPEGGPPICPRCTMPLDLAGETRTALETTPPPPSRVDLTGRKVGNYTILAEVSRGAMGVVYKARQHELDRIVAIKVLIAGEMASEAQVERFRREARAAARLRHPAIVPIHEVGVFEGKHYYTMDFIEGRDLGSLIRERKITIRRALDVAAEVADALEYAHRQGVIHRDIKPSNIMIDNDGRVHITDFGLAKQLGSDPEFTRTGTTIGTPAYMPPEQASGESHRVDRRADIYSLGAVLYEMLTGRPPFSGDTMMNTLMQVLNDEPIPPKRLNPRIHRDIQTIVQKAMEKSPERRYQTMEAFAADIRAFIAGESISAKPAGPLYRAWRFLRRHSAAALAALAVLTIALTSAAVILDIRRKSEARIRDARETGKREGAAVAARKLQLQEKPTIKTVFQDDFQNRNLAKRWAVEEGSWKVRPRGGLAVEPAPHAAIRTRSRFTGNVRVEFEAVVLPEPNGATQREAAIGCFIGSAWARSYRFSFGYHGRNASPRVVLMNRRQVVAESDCAPPHPGTHYYIELERTPLGVELRVESDGEDPPVHVAYNELTLPQQLPREFSAGIFTRRARLLVRHFRVYQEFPPAKLSPIKAAEALFRDGNIAEARNQFEQIARGYEGRYEGLAALVGLALCDEAERRYPQALKTLSRIETLARSIRHAELPRLLNRARLHAFFVNAALNNYSKALAPLERIAASDSHVQEGWLWHFPRYLDQMLNNRAYDQALGLLQATVFGPARLSLHDALVALRASPVALRMNSRVRALADAFCSTGRYEKVKEVYDAWPTAELADPFAKAARAAIAKGDLEGAMALLAFCQGEGVTSPDLTKAAVELANAFTGRGEFLRVATLYEVFPDKALQTAFLAATRAATKAGKLDEAFTLLDETIRDFPDRAPALLANDGAALDLANACLTRGQFLKLIDIHSLFGPEHDTRPLLGLFVKATHAAIQAGEPGAALRLLEHCRISFGVLDAELAGAAAELINFYDRGGDYARVADALLAYPNDSLATAVAQAIAHAVEGNRIHDAIVLLGHYARLRFPLANLPLASLGHALATLDPGDEEGAALLDDYRRARELYESPVATAAFALALGDAYLSANKLELAFAEYQQAADPEGLLRAGCVALELGLTDRAAAIWARLRELSDKDDPHAAAAALMLAELSPEAFRQKVRDEWKAPLVNFLVGLRLWTEADDAADEALAKARAAKGEWFSPLAARPRSPLPHAAPTVP